MERVKRYYAALGEREWSRLESPSGALEFEVNTSIIRRYLRPESRVLDIGGGPGRYASWLAGLGHRVVLADLSPHLLEIARQRFVDPPSGSTFEAVAEADARDLSRWSDGEFDAAVCLGPFYHLPDPADRERAARELRRVVREGGVVFVAFMPWQALLRRTAAVAEERHRLLDPGWLTGLVEHGRFVNDVPGRFDMAHGAIPSRIPPFFEALDFETLGLFASEGLGMGIEAVIAELRESDRASHDALMRIIVDAADDPCLHGLSTHLLYVGRIGAMR